MVNPEVVAQIAGTSQRVIYWPGRLGSTYMPATKGPSYHEVAADLRSKIRRGEYPAGSKLPTREQLCEMYGVSNQTVDTAKVVLRTEGLIADRTKAGTFVVDPLPPDTSSASPGVTRTD
jgi:GntR family transcriptional regulator